MKKKVLSIVLAAVVALSMAACGSGASSTATTDSSGSATAEGTEYKDTLVVGTYGDQDTLDPQVNVTNDKVPVSYTHLLWPK